MHCSSRWCRSSSWWRCATSPAPASTASSHGSPHACPRRPPALDRPLDRPRHAGGLSFWWTKDLFPHPQADCHRPGRATRQRGAVILMVCFLLFFLLGFIAIAFDFGHLFIVKTELQTAMD